METVLPDFVVSHYLLLFPSIGIAGSFWGKEYVCVHASLPFQGDAQMVAEHE